MPYACDPEDSCGQGGGKFFIYLIGGLAAGGVGCYVAYFLPGNLMNVSRGRGVFDWRGYEQWWKALIFIQFIALFSMPVFFLLAFIDANLWSVGWGTALPVSGTWTVLLVRFFSRKHSHTVLPPHGRTESDANSITQETRTIGAVHEPPREQLPLFDPEVLMPSTTSIAAKELARKNAMLYGVLIKRFFGQELGLAREFQDIRKIPKELLITIEDDGFIEPELLQTLRESIQAEIHEHCSGFSPSVTSPHMALVVSNWGSELAKNWCDLARRLTRSILFDKKGLFIDRGDIEQFGQETVRFVYRLALQEVTSHPECAERAEVAQHHPRSGWRQIGTS